MDKEVRKMVEKHCECRSENKLLVETVSVCPGCFVFNSTAVYEIPQEKLLEALARIEAAMADLGIPRKPPMEVRRPREIDVVDLAQEGP